MPADAHATRGTQEPEPEPEAVAVAGTGAGQFTCGQCRAQFCSRNELFSHLDAADHFVDGIASSTIGPVSASLCASPWVRLSACLSLRVLMRRCSH